MMSLEERVRLLEDERAILNTLYTYGHGIDYDLEEEFLDCWTETAVLVWPHVDYDGPPRRMDGKAAIAEAFRAHTHAPDRYHKHLLIEPLISIDGDRATAESFYSRLDVYTDGPGIRSFGRYRDVLVRCDDGRWRFEERVTEGESRRPGPP